MTDKTLDTRDRLSDFVQKNVTSHAELESPTPIRRPAPAAVGGIQALTDLIAGGKLGDVLSQLKQATATVPAAAPSGTEIVSVIAQAIHVISTELEARKGDLAEARLAQREMYDELEALRKAERDRRIGELMATIAQLEATIVQLRRAVGDAASALTETLPVVGDHTETIDRLNEIIDNLRAVQAP